MFLQPRFVPPVPGVFDELLKRIADTAAPKMAARPMKWNVLPHPSDVFFTWIFSISSRADLPPGSASKPNLVWFIVFLYPFSMRIQSRLVSPLKGCDFTVDSGELSPLFSSSEARDFFSILKYRDNRIKRSLGGEIKSLEFLFDRSERWGL